MDTHSNEILVIGSYNVDLSARTTVLPKPGETVLGNKFTTGPGGKGANQAIAAARAGGIVSFAGCVGTDLFGQEAEKKLQSEGIDTARLIKDQTIPTGTAMILVDEQAENQIVVCPGANHQIRPDQIETLMKPGFAWMLLQFEIPYETVKRAVEIGHQNGVKIILNPAPALRGALELLPMVDVFTPNETETEFLTGISIHFEADAEKAAKHLLQAGAQNVLITMGSKGIYMATQQNGKFQGEVIPALQVQPLDTTGAGDCFNGAMAAALAEGKTLKQAVQFGIAAAGISVTRSGAGESMPFRAEIQQMIVFHRH